MPKGKQRAAAGLQHSETEFPDVSWDDLRYFLASAEGGSFRRGAETLNVDSATMTRRIERLETSVGQRLFIRGVQGIQLTAHGRAILDDVTAMARAGRSVRQRVRGDEVQGLVKVAVTEGLGTYWILPKLIDFQQANQLLTVDLRATMDPTNVAKLEADVSIQFHKPDNPDLICRRLGRLHNYPFVSLEYRRRFGIPSSIEKARTHRFVHQTSPLLDDGALARGLGVEDVTGIVGIRTNSSAAVLYACERGAGIAFLPSYALSLGAPLVPVDMGVEYPLDIWMIYHRDVQRSKRHKIVKDWLVRIFDPAHYPCFLDEFIHPNDLVGRMGAASAGNRVKGYAAASLGCLTNTRAEPVDY